MKPILSICIPTYNRRVFLEETINSITSQFNNQSQSRVEIVISDNKSNDGTQEYLKKIRDKFTFVRIHMNKRNTGAKQNIIKVGTYAKGEYIWFFTDDDTQRKNAIKDVLKIIEEKHPDVILCNVDGMSRDMKKTMSKNNLNVNRDYFLHGRKEFFKFLNKMFFYHIDWYSFYYSNLILKQNVFDITDKLSRKYNSKLDSFPHSLGIFYSKNDYNIYILSKRIVKFRNFNLRWGPKKKRDYLFFLDRVYSCHYKNIEEINSDILSLEFKFKLFLKKFIRRFRLYILLPLFNY